MSKIIFGGAFDPIHNGHINMALKASETLDSDVYFVLSPISVWKELETPIQHKINMVNAAIEDYPRFHLELFEVNSGKKVNYSIDTIKYFKEKYPNEQLYLLIGGDQVEQFHNWNSAYELSRLAQIVYFNRNGYNYLHENIYKYNMQAIPGETIDAASSQIRILNSLQLPEKVAKYIEDNRLYYVGVIANLIDSKRVDHSISVARLAYEIAEANHLNNPKKYYVAGILHDIGKTDCIKLIDVKDALRGNEDLNPAIYHQFLGSVLAKQIFDIQDPFILQAIRFHTTGCENMNPIAIIVYVADKLDPLRGFDSSELISEMKKDYIKGFSKVLKANVEYFEANNKEYKNRYTLACLKQYMK